MALAWFRLRETRCRSWLMLMRNNEAFEGWKNVIAKIVFTNLLTKNPVWRRKKSSTRRGGWARGRMGCCLGGEEIKKKPIIYSTRARASPKLGARKQSDSACFMALNLQQKTIRKVLKTKFIVCNSSCELFRRNIQSRRALQLDFRNAFSRELLGKSFHTATRCSGSV